MKSEAQVQQEIRIEASRLGHRVWRNNSGVLAGPEGRPIRFGLCNESPAMNAEFKSSDLIGITADGRFLAIECKPEGWRFTGTPRELAQQRFLELVRRMGGVSGFVTCVEDFYRVVSR